MSLATTLPAAILEAILTHLAALFLVGANDPAAARHAAAQMLAAYDPQTEDELRLAAKIVGFSFQALEALGQAAAPDLPITRILRLRGGAVSLSRASEKAERRLDQLQKARRQGIAAQPAAPQPEPEPRAEKATALVQDTRATIAAAKATGMSWTKAHEQRARDRRLAANKIRADATIANQANPAMLGTLPALAL
jgi:hypothetical protein